MTEQPKEVLVYWWDRLTPDERNRLVAERVTDWTPEPCPQSGLSWTDAVRIWNEQGQLYQCARCYAGPADTPGDWDTIEHTPLNLYPDYSRSLDVAWTVIDHFSAITVTLRRVQGEHCCRFESGAQGTAITAWATRPSEAVCIAALRAVGVVVF